MQVEAVIVVTASYSTSHYGQDGLSALGNIRMVDAALTNGDTSDKPSMAD